MDLNRTLGALRECPTWTDVAASLEIPEAAAREAVTGAMRVPTTETPVPSWMRVVRVAASARHA